MAETKINLNAGFEVSEKKGVTVHNYKDGKAFISNLPESLSEKVIKEVNHYQGGYIKSCTEEALKLVHSEFKSGKEQVVAKFPFGANANSSVTIITNKAVKQVIPNREQDGKGSVQHVMAPQIKIKVKEQYHGGPTKDYLSEQKKSIDSKFNK